MINEQFLSYLFYQQDPMHTSCRVNRGMEDEYDRQARHIVHMVSLGVPFKTAVHDVFSFFWWDGCMIENSLIVAIVEAQYYNHISKYSI
jgi:hypothetical protein